MYYDIMLQLISTTASYKIPVLCVNVILEPLPKNVVPTLMLSCVVTLKCVSPHNTCMMELYIQLTGMKLNRKVILKIHFGKPYVYCPHQKLRALRVICGSLVLSLSMVIW